MSLTTKLLYKYRQIKCRHPFLVNAAQIGVLVGAGDIIAQTYVEERCNIDWNRTLKMMAIGGLIVGPASTKFFKYIDRRFMCKPCVSCSTSLQVFKKVLATEMMFAPIMTATILTAANFMNGEQSLSDDLSEKFDDIIIQNWKFWPLIHFIRWMMPFRHQMFMYKTGVLLWSVYMSWKLHLDECMACCGNE